MGYSEELVDHMYRMPAKFDYVRAGRSNIHCCEVHVAYALLNTDWSWGEIDYLFLLLCFIVYLIHVSFKLNQI